MKKTLVLPLSVIALLLLQTNIFSQKKPPIIFIDKGACPFECCTYGKWKTEEKVVLYARPDKRSKIIGSVPAKAKVTALTGEVRTVGGRFVVKKQFEKYQPGDVLWLYTYLGEGVFKIWYKGKMYEEKLGFSPYGGSMGSRCEVKELCWGEMDKELDQTWWIKIKTAKGVTGWTTQSENFSGADACG